MTVIKIVLFFSLSLSFSVKSFADVGIDEQGNFSQCPASPNCVSTQETDPDKKIEPHSMETSIEEAMTKLVKIINSLKGATVIKQETNYLHAEFKSSIFGFIDDLEIYLDENKKLIHIRSSSRSGYYDFGVNRKRVYKIMFEYAQS